MSRPQNLRGSVSPSPAKVRREFLRTVTSGVGAKDDPAQKVAAESGQRHAEAALRHVASGDYAGEHWLASFVVYLLSTPSPN